MCLNLRKWDIQTLSICFNMCQHASKFANVSNFAKLVLTCQLVLNLPEYFKVCQQVHTTFNFLKFFQMANFFYNYWKSEDCLTNTCVIFWWMVLAIRWRTGFWMCLLIFCLFAGTSGFWDEPCIHVIRIFEKCNKKKVRHQMINLFWYILLCLKFWPLKLCQESEYFDNFVFCLLKIYQNYNFGP